MSTPSLLLYIAPVCFFSFATVLFSASALRGIAPQGIIPPCSQSFYLLFISDEKYYFDGVVIRCRDGSELFSRDRLNDGFCDCGDGIDDPDLPLDLY
jgi:hypothetical protein